MCYYTSIGTRKNNWMYEKLKNRMDENLFSVSTAKACFVHHPEFGRRHVLGLIDYCLLINII